MTNEEWKPVVGYEGFYDVSSLGRVHSHHHGGRILKLIDNKRRAYLQFSAFRDGTSRVMKVHQVVAEAFIGPRPEGQLVRHLDGDYTNNTVPNLAYGTQLENMEDQRRHGTQFWSNRTHCPQGHPYEGDNLKRRSDRPNARECRECSREQTRSRRRMGGSGPMEHGWVKYSTEYCRCDVCTEDHRLHSKQVRAERHAFVAEHGLPDRIRHGASAYANWGCRCEVCTAASTARARRYYQPKPKVSDPTERIAS